MPSTVLAPPAAPAAAPAVEVMVPQVIESAVLDIPVNDVNDASLYRCKFPTTVENREVTRCEAQSFVRIVMATGSLYCCGHHYLANRDGLHKVALEVHDQRTAINQSASVSANAA